MEIGSEFWIDNYEINEENQRSPHWLNKYGHFMLTSSGRGAINFILEHVEPRVKRTLLPAYICDSVIAPFKKHGYDIIYYDLDEGLCPQNMDIGDAEIGVFLHMGYFGFPTNDGLSNLIMELKSQSVIIVEDVTHTLFSSYHNQTNNDFVIGSIRKWAGMPSGGFVASNKIIKDKLPYPPKELINLRSNSLRSKCEYMGTLNESFKDGYLKGLKKAEQMLDEDVNSYKIDGMSELIVRNLNIKQIEDTRRANFEFLLENLKRIKGIKVIFTNIKNDITPMFFPIYVTSNREKLMSALIAKQIYCPVHWPISSLLDCCLSKTTRETYDSILSIPCDQRYGLEDMERIVDAIKDFVWNE